MVFKNKVLKLSLLLNLLLIGSMAYMPVLHFLEHSNDEKIKEVEFDGPIIDGYMSENFFRKINDVYFDKKMNIVMLGDSITARMDWNRFLGREDIVNLGLGGSTTENFLKRINSVYELKPQLCFVLGGINDFLHQDKPVAEVFENIKTIAEQLKEHNITPIIESTLFVTGALEQARGVDTKVLILNKLLKEFCDENSIEYLDLNKAFLKDHKLLRRYDRDGVHLDLEGYKLWRLGLLAAFKKYGL